MSLCQNWDLLDLCQRQSWDFHGCCCCHWNLLNPLSRESSYIDSRCLSCYRHWCNVAQGAQLLCLQAVSLVVEFFTTSIYDICTKEVGGDFKDNAVGEVG